MSEMVTKAELDEVDRPLKLVERSDAQRYFDALKKIARKYQTVDQLRRSAANIGLSPEEHVEMAYENLQAEAEQAIRGKRRPR